MDFLTDEEPGKLGEELILAWQVSVSFDQESHSVVFLGVLDS